LSHESHSQNTPISYVCLRLFYLQFSYHTNEPTDLGYPVNNC